LLVCLFCLRYRIQEDKPKANGSENGLNDLEHGVVEVFVCAVCFTETFHF